MSDTYTISMSATDSEPGYRSRLRPGSFTSPSGVESFFLIDSLNRTRTKQTATHEIVDSDTTIMQDMGSGLHSFSLSVYFTGDDGDEQSDTFFASLFEHYTPDAPGVLSHPRWGDVNVIPTGAPAQGEELVDGAGVFRVTVTFQETESLNVANTASLSVASITAEADTLDDANLDAVASIDDASESSLSRLRSQIKAKVAIIADTVSGLADELEDVIDEVDSQIADIQSAISDAASVVTIYAQCQTLIRTIASVPAETSNLVTQIATMAESLFESSDSDIASSVSTINKQNAAANAQTLGSAAVEAVVLSAINTTYNSREEVNAIIDSISDVYSSYNDTLETAQNTLDTNIGTAFIASTDVASSLYGMVFDAQNFLLNGSFSLKIRKTYTTIGDTDILSLCWKHYQSLDEDVLSYFIKTNQFTANEYISIDAGRSYYIYE